MSAGAVVTCPSCGRRNRVPAAATGTPACGSCHSRLPWIVEAGDDDFAGTVEASPLPVLVDVWAPWCGPCRTVTPVLEHLAADHAGRVKLVKVNADESPRTSARFGIQAIPTLLVLRGGTVVARQTGAAPEGKLSAWLREALEEGGGAGGRPG